MNGTSARKQITASFSGVGGSGMMCFTAFLPAGRKNAPAFLLICNRPTSNIDPTRTVKSPFWPAEEIVARGYAALAFQVDEVDPDKDDGFKNGVHPIFDRKRGGDSWATISAWGWGASRVLDWCETESGIDARRVAVVGHSRGGKAALWCGAEDERFALVVSNDSGCTGAALSRGKKGETIADINRAFPHWFCANYKKFDGRETELPVDQHELLALIAPRPVYVASASEDAWADPPSEFAACAAASPVYELLGRAGVGGDQMPRPESPLQSGTIGYHVRTGKHDLTLYDWLRYLDFADKRMR